MNIVDILLIVIIILLLGYCSYLKLHQPTINTDDSPYDELRVQVSNNDIKLYIQEATEPYRQFMESREIDFSINCFPESMMGWIDTDIMDKIILLLLSDMVKNMSDGGKIAIDVYANKDYDRITIRINDNAARMPDTSIFIVQSLVHLHHGVMRKDYLEHQGNMILLEFPIKKNVFPEVLDSQTTESAKPQPSTFHIPTHIPLTIPTIQLPEGYDSGTASLGELVQQAYESSDQMFLQRAVNCVKEHLDDSDYDRDAFAADMGASASTLYNKLRTITGKNVTAFIRDIRIKTACQLAKENPDLRVSDIAYRVGFKDPKYFATTFKKETGYQPKDYFDKLRVKK